MNFKTPKFLFFLASFLFLSNLIGAKNYFPSPKSKEDSVLYGNKRKVIRTNCITGMLYSPHLDFSSRINKHWGWGVAALVRTGGGIPGAYAYLEDNPDHQLKGFGGFGDLIYYQPNYYSSKSRYWTFALRVGYRYLHKEQFPIGSEKSTFYCNLTRTRQDIVSDLRISYVYANVNSHLVFDWFVGFGGRVSQYKTQFFRIDYPHQPLPTYIRVNTNGNTGGFPANGCYVLGEYTLGLEIGFGSKN